MPRPTHPLFSLDGQVAWFTCYGSEFGIGFARAQLLAASGASVAFCATVSRTDARVNTLVAKVKADFGHIINISSSNGKA